METKVKKVSAGRYSVLANNGPHTRYKEIGQVWLVDGKWRTSLDESLFPQKKFAVAAVLGEAVIQSQKPKPLAEVLAESPCIVEEDGEEKEVQPPPARSAPPSDLLDDVKAATAFENWLRGTEFSRLSFYEAFKFGRAYERGDV